MKPHIKYVVVSVLCFYNVPLVSDEEHKSTEEKVSTWLREQQFGGEDTSEYYSDLESSWSNE